MNKIVVTMDDIKRYKVITEVIEKRLTLRDASELLFLSYRHAIRLKQKVKDNGLEGILHISNVSNGDVDELVDLLIGVSIRYLKRIKESPFSLLHLYVLKWYISDNKKS